MHEFSFSKYFLTVMILGGGAVALMAAAVYTPAESPRAEAAQSPRAETAESPGAETAQSPGAEAAPLDWSLWESRQKAAADPAPAAKPPSDQLQSTATSESPKREGAGLIDAILGLVMLYLYIVLAIHAIFSLIRAVIACSKGRGFFAWYCYAFFLFIVALVHSIVLRPYVPCPHCGMQLDDAQVMYHVYTVHRFSDLAPVSAPQPVRYLIPG
jgi:hypothetical protein